MNGWFSLATFKYSIMYWRKTAKLIAIWDYIHPTFQIFYSYELPDLLRYASDTSVYL